MKCRVRQCISGADFCYVNGDIVDFPEDTARAYAGMDVVEIIEESSAVAPPPERTADRPRRKRNEN